MLVPKNEHILHVMTDAAASLPQQVAQYAKKTQSEATQLVIMGAVFVNKERVMDPLVQIPAQTYLRVHLYPKRYPVEKVIWKNVIVEETPQYLVINKPAGIPLISTVDNFYENCDQQLQFVLRQKLFVTHRLDRATSGLAVFAKTKEFQSKFNKLLIERRVTKKYRAVSEGRVEPGRYVHYMEPKLRTPMVVVAEERAGWMRCELLVERVDERRIGNQEFFEHSIQLITGRTHQIRVQLSALHAPILGDLMYGGKMYGDLGFSSDAFALQAYALSFLDKQYQLTGSIDFW